MVTIKDFNGLNVGVGSPGFPYCFVYEIIDSKVSVDEDEHIYEIPDTINGRTKKAFFCNLTEFLLERLSADGEEERLKNYHIDIGEDVAVELSAVHTFFFVYTGVPMKLSDDKKTLLEVSMGLSKCVIPTGVTKIADLAFKSHKKLKSVKMPLGLTSIGEAAFAGCFGLRTIEIPESVVSIGAIAFQSCIKLQSITLPCGIEKIEQQTFCNCRELSSVTIPDSVTHIGPYAFSSCDILGSITIPDSVTHIGLYAFRGCYTLRSITLPAVLTEIGKLAFQYCTKLTEFHMKATDPSKISVSEDAFTEMPLDRCTLYVPKGSEEAYKQNKIFSQFGHVVGE